MTNSIANGITSTYEACPGQSYMPKAARLNIADWPDRHSALMTAASNNATEFHAGMPDSYRLYLSLLYQVPKLCIGHLPEPVYPPHCLWQ